MTRTDISLKNLHQKECFTQSSKKLEFFFVFEMAAKVRKQKLISGFFLFQIVSSGRWKKTIIWKYKKKVCFSHWDNMLLQEKFALLTENFNLVEKRYFMFLQSISS